MYINGYFTVHLNKSSIYQFFQKQEQNFNINHIFQSKDIQYLLLLSLENIFTFKNTCKSPIVTGNNI